MFINTAWAQDAATTAATGAPTMATLMFSYLPILFIIAIFYYLIIRPQNQAAKAHAALVKNLERGDVVLIDGGLIGEVSKVNEQILHLRVNPQDEIAVARASVKKLLSADEAKGWEPAGTPHAKTKK
jgi:preprotein translocase subunit YajC